MGSYDAGEGPLLPARHHAGRGADARAAVGGARRAAGQDARRGRGSRRRLRRALQRLSRSTARCCYAAKKLGRPVKWVGTRSEVFLADEQARDIVHTARWRSTRTAASSACASTISPTSAPTSRSPARSSTRVGLVNVHLRRVRRAGGLRARPAGAHQHRADRRLPRRRPPGRVLCARAPGRPGGARARHGPGGVPPPQHDPEGEDALQAGRRLRVRLRRFRGVHGQGAAAVRLERV